MTLLGLELGILAGLYAGFVGTLVYAITERRPKDPTAAKRHDAHKIIQRSPVERVMKRAFRRANYDPSNLDVVLEGAKRLVIDWMEAHRIDPKELEDLEGEDIAFRDSPGESRYLVHVGYGDITEKTIKDQSLVVELDDDILGFLGAKIEEDGTQSLETKWTSSFRGRSTEIHENVGCHKTISNFL